MVDAPGNESSGTSYKNQPTPRCPQCGYDLRVQVATLSKTRQSVVCPECGESMGLADLMRVATSIVHSPGVLARQFAVNTLWLLTVELIFAVNCLMFAALSTHTWLGLTTVMTGASSFAINQKLVRRLKTPNAGYYALHVVGMLPHGALYGGLFAIQFVILILPQWALLAAVTR